MAGIPETGWEDGVRLRHRFESTCPGACPSMVYVRLMRLVFRFRSSQILAALSDANFGIKGTLGRVLVNAGTGRMSALGANRACAAASPRLPAPLMSHSGHWRSNFAVTPQRCPLVGFVLDGAIACDGATSSHFSAVRRSRGRLPRVRNRPSGCGALAC